jgi:TatD DNase family protein
MIRAIDAHSHIHGKEFDADRVDVLARMKESGVGAITVGCSLEDSKKAVALAEGNDNVWATIGIHPTDTEEIFNESDFVDLVNNEKVVAIGECGLDYFRIKNNESGIVNSEKERQKDNFKRQVEFALKHNKPLMIHCRPSTNSIDAHDDMLAILNSLFIIHNSKLRGNIHFFTGTLDVAQKYFDLGFTVSIPGVVTFAKEVSEVVEKLPIEKILIETDCPYATPVPNRGKRNEPVYLLETAKYIAKLKDSDLEVILSKTIQNTKQIFTID